MSMIMLYSMVMKYKTHFHAFQEAYITKYPNAVKMRSYLPPLIGKSILDVGCGSGIDTAFFAHSGAKKIAGVDISKELMTIAKESTPTADVRNESFSYLSWKNKTFDIVWSKYALNCAENIITPLKEIARVCKNNGTVLLQVTHPFRSLSILPSQDYFDEGVIVDYILENGKILQEPHHTISSWINAITEAGFHITHSEEIINKPKSEYKGVITPSAIIFVLKKI